MGTVRMSLARAGPPEGPERPVVRLFSNYGFVTSMEFFHFGPERRLFGSYVPQAGGEGASSVAVLCYPFGQEYIRAHKAFRQLAVLLSRTGVPVLRFDYSGTGDSEGVGTEASVDEWLDDVNEAIGEARRRSGVDQVRLGGLRLGATLAALAARDRAEVERLVLWDPVVTGTAFVEDLESRIGHREGTTWWVYGFPITESLREEICRIDLRDVQLHAKTRVIQMLSRPDDNYDAPAEALADHAGEVESRVVPSPWDWNYSDAMGGILLPRDMVRGVVNALGG
jgi:alpha/beta superfamily hydrolase